MRGFNRQQHQPQAPIEVEQFLELERGRFAYALQQGIAVSENSPLIESALDMVATATKKRSNDPTTESDHATDITTVIAEAAFVVDSLQAALSQLPSHVSLPRHERAEDIHFFGTASGLGSVVLHGLKVSAWNEQYPHIPLLPDNAVAKIVSDSISVKCGSIRVVRKIGRILQHPH